MSKARANIQDIQFFESNSENEGLAASQVKSALQEIDKINDDIAKAVVTLGNGLSDCEKAETYINGVVDELQRRYDEIQVRLDTLFASEPSPAEELVSDYDDEGNCLGSHWEETSAHSAWASEVSRVESELSAVGAKLNKAKGLQTKIRNKIGELKRVIESLNAIKQRNDGYKAELTEHCQEIINSSQVASAQLNNALAALELYLAEMINITSSTLCASFSWHTGASKQLDSGNVEKQLLKSENELKKLKVVNNIDFSQFDPKVAATVVAAFKDAKKDFPKLSMEYLGTVSGNLNGIKETVAQYHYKKILASKEGKNLSKEEIMERSIEEAEMFMMLNGLGTSDNTLAYSIKIPKWFEEGEVLQKYNGIAINDIYATDNERFTQVKEVEVQSKHKPIGCNTPRATVDHELGHEIDKLLGACSDEVILDIYDEFRLSKSPIDELSGYATENMQQDPYGKGIREFIAEAYSEYKNNEHPRKFAVSVYNRFIQLKKEK